MINGAAHQTSQTAAIPAIGVLLDSVDTFFLRRTVEELIDSAEDQGLHTVFYFGGSLEKGKTAGPYSYSYTLPDPEAIKALIVLPHSISPWTPDLSVKLIQEQFPNIPVYVLFADSPDCYCAFANESPAIEAMMQHLLKDHSYKHFAIMMGQDSPESLSRLRMNIVQKILTATHLEIQEMDIFTGDFQIEDGKAAARKILARKEDAPDVLLCMNDQLALGASKEFLDNGISIPEDIALVGFDDIEETASVPCSFTSINYPVGELANNLIERIASDLSGKTVYAKEKFTLDAQFFNRESCGCTSWFEKPVGKTNEIDANRQKRTSAGALKRVAILKRTLEDIITECIEKSDTTIFEEFIHKTMQIISRSGDMTNSFIDIFSTQWSITLLKYQDFSSQVFINTLFVDAFRMLIQTRTKIFARMHNNDMGTLGFYQNCNALIGQKLTVHSAIKALGSNLPQLGIFRCLLVFIDPDNPEIGEIHLSYKEGRITDIPETDFVRIPIKTLLENGISSVHEPIGVLTVAHENSVYGYIVLSIAEKHFDQFSMVQKMVSQIIDSAMTNELLSSHIQTLTQKNDILSRLSIVDEFTGLCNRRALYVTGRNMYQRAIDTVDTSCFIFLDVDGLKKINDTYGHKQGDAAILALANILKKSFREKDLVVRYGGDEFVVLMISIQEDIMHKALSRISESIVEFNDKKLYEWTLAVSWGYVFNDGKAVPKSFENIIEESDARLYLEKRKRKGLV